MSPTSARTGRCTEVGLLNIYPVIIITNSLLLLAGCDGCLNWFNMGFGYSGLNTDPKDIGYTPEGKDKV